MPYNDACRTAMITVLMQVRALLAMPDNDFSWSGWQDQAQALNELDGILSTLALGEAPSVLHFKVLFAPTGPLQEVSIDSGWGDRFLELANQFDAAIAECG